MISWFDIIILIPVGFALYKGFSKGFIIEVASIIALLFGIYGAIGFSDFTANLLKSKVEINQSAIPYLAYTLTFIAIVVLVFLLAKLLEGVVKIAALGTINKLLGALFGLLKISLIVSGLIFLINCVDVKRVVFSPQLAEKSYAYKYIEKIFPSIFPSSKKILANSNWKMN